MVSVEECFVFSVFYGAKMVFDLSELDVSDVQRVFKISLDIKFFKILSKHHCRLSSATNMKGLKNGSKLSLDKTGAERE